MSEADSLHERANAKGDTGDHQSRSATEPVTQRRDCQGPEEASRLKKRDDVC
jgi:hypothetical protein